jgi:hypothetical protein
MKIAKDIYIYIFSNFHDFFIFEHVYMRSTLELSVELPVARVGVVVALPTFAVRIEHSCPLRGTN